MNVVLGHAKIAPPLVSVFKEIFERVKPAGMTLNVGDGVFVGVRVAVDVAVAVKVDVAVEVDVEVAVSVSGGGGCLVLVG